MQWTAHISCVTDSVVAQSTSAPRDSGGFNPSFMSYHAFLIFILRAENALSINRTISCFAFQMQLNFFP